MQNNSIRLIGHVGKDPEMRLLESGVKLAKFSIATNKSYKDKAGEWQTETIWHDCIGWTKVADLVDQSVSKGSFLKIEGELTYNRWEDKNGGKHKDAQIKVDSILFLQKPPKLTTPDSYGDSVPADTAIPEDNDTPF